MDNSLFFMILGIVIIVVVVFLAILFLKMRRKPQKWEEEKA
jgi:hypothetical protein